MTKTTEDKRLKEVKKVIEEWDTYPRETQIALESAISMARILTMIRDNEKAGQEGQVKILRKFNKTFNKMVEKIVEKNRWENTISNQRTVSFILGCIVSFILMIIRISHIN